MELKRLSERVWISPFEEERDRPILGYIRGDKWSLAVDAGHSDDHVGAFYKVLAHAGLPLPSLTVLTHWHWDHTFGMHAVHGLCLANRLTGRHLRDIRNRIQREGRDFFLSMDVKIAKEYADSKPIVVTMADMLYSGEMMLDPGNCPVHIFQAESPHTDDSTLVHVPGEKLLFLGDAACGTFPTWERDPGSSRKLADVVASTGAEICIEGHCEPLSGAEEVADLRKDS